jgi:metal-responsive CopG/Arc/MetJ family transcriptional regulator
MSGRTPPSYDHRLSVNITRQMYDRLNQIASTRDEAISEVAREAFRLFLDQQEDLVASRKHFTKSFQRRLDHTDWQLSVQLQMLSYLTALFMTMVNQEEIRAEDVLHVILDQAQENDWQNVLHNARSKERRKAAEKPTAS